MAKLLKLPGQSVIDGFKGVVDYYVWCGIACARKWPKSPGHDRAPAVQAQWAAFAWAAKNWIELSPAIKEAYNQLAVSTKMTGKDIFTKGFINGSTLYLDGF